MFVTHSRAQDQVQSITLWLNINCKCTILIVDGNKMIYSLYEIRWRNYANIPPIAKEKDPLTKQPKAQRVKSNTLAARGAEPTMHMRTRPPSSFCTLWNTSLSHKLVLVTTPLWGDGVEVIGHQPYIVQCTSLFAYNSCIFHCMQMTSCVDTHMYNYKLHFESQQKGAELLREWAGTLRLLLLNYIYKDHLQAKPNWKDIICEW